MKSIMQKEKMCWVCGTTIALHEHHCIYGTANRKKSEQYGLKVWLCPPHHNMSDEGVHFNKEFDTALKQEAQRYFEETHGTRDDFRREFGRSYL